MFLIVTETKFRNFRQSGSFNRQSSRRGKINIINLLRWNFNVASFRVQQRSFIIFMFCIIWKKIVLYVYTEAVQEKLETNHKCPNDMEKRIRIYNRIENWPPSSDSTRPLTLGYRYCSTDFFSQLTTGFNYCSFLTSHLEKNLNKLKTA